MDGMARLGGPPPWGTGRASVGPRLGGSPPITSATGYPWVDGDILYAADLNAAIVISAANVFVYGATGDGVTDDTAAVQAAFNAAASGGEVWFPPGNYVLTSAISLTTTGNLTVRGAGPGVSVLNCASNGIAIATGASQYVTVEELSIVTTAAGSANTGLAITAPNASTAVRLRNLIVSGNVARTTGWQTSINLTCVGSSVLDGLTVLMPDGVRAAGPTGILYAGLDASHYGYNLRIANSLVQGGQYGIRMGDYIEGVLIDNAIILGNDYGVYWPRINSDSAPNMLEITNSHCNPTTCGVYAQVGFVSISNTFFLGISGSPNFTGIDLEGSAGIAISTNNFYGHYTGTEIGVIVNNASNTPVVIAGNCFRGLNTRGISLLGNTAAATIVGNSCTNVLVTDSTGTGTNQALANNVNGNPDISSGANGITYFGLPSGPGHAIGFSWNGAILQAYVDGIAEGFIPTAGGSFGGPTWTTGSAAPSAIAPVGSLYSRAGGAVGATLYVSRGGGTWAPVAGV